MSIRIYWGKRGHLRLYSGTADGGGGTFCFEVAFAQMDFNGPMQRPHPDEIPVVDRGLMDGHHHYIQGSDEIIMQGIAITFTANLDSEINRQNLVNAMSNPHRINPWDVGGVTWTNVNGTTQIFNGYGSLVSVAVPFSPIHDRVHVEVLWEGDTEPEDAGFRYSEVFFPPNQQNVRESDTNVQIQANGMCYGGISFISTFSPGTVVS